MLPFRKKSSKGGADIHLLPNSDSASRSQPIVWLSNEDICGRAVFKLPSDVDFTHARIQVKGVVHTRTIGGDALSRSSRTEKLPFLAAEFTSKAQSGSKTGDGIVRIPFRFNLDDIHSSARSSFVTDLPPSLNSRNEKLNLSEARKGGSEAHYDVTYSITASAFSKKGVEASTDKTIQVMPVSQDDGPLAHADCPGEYIFAPSNPPPRTVSRSKPRPFKIELAGQQPEAVSLSPNEFFSGYTRIPFILKALPESSAKFDPKSLPKQCRVKARLTAKTLITSDGIEQNWIPIIEQGRHTENTCLKVHKSEEQEFPIDLSRWQHVTPSTGDQFAISKFAFDFKVSTDQATVPTFFTPLLSRRYAIEISIRYPDGTCPDAKLTLPLQISYEIDDLDDLDDKEKSTVVTQGEVDSAQESD